MPRPNFWELLEMETAPVTCHRIAQTSLDPPHEYSSIG